MVFDVPGIGLAEADLAGRLLRVNAGFCRITGFDRGELVGRPFTELTHADDLERDRLAFRDFVASGASTYDIEKRYRRKDGGATWVRVIVHLVRAENGEPVGTAAAIIDVSARKEAEEAERAAVAALRHSERQLRILAAVGEIASRVRDTAALIEAIGECVARELHVSRCGFADVDLEGGRIIVTNDYHGDLPSLAGIYPAAEYADYFFEDALAGRVVSVDDAATDPRTAARYAVAFKPISLRAHVTVPLHHDGRWVAGFWLTDHVPHAWTESDIGTIKLVSERVWAVIERQRAEERLRHSEERFRSVLENMSEGLMLFNPSGDLIYQNAASLRIHGFADAKAGLLAHDAVPTTWVAWDVAGKPITFAEWPVSRVFRMERFQNQVLQVRRTDTGQEFYGSYNGSPICDASGRLIFGFITIRDITSQTLAQQALEESRRRVQAFFDSDMMGAIYWTVDGRITDANGRFLRMVGYTREELLGGVVRWAEMTPPEYAAQDEFALRELRETGLDTPYEKEYLRKDGTRIPILIGAAMVDEQRHEGVAFVLDLSDRRRAELALRRSEEEFRTLADSMPALAWSANADGYITWYNQRWYEYTGKTPEEMAGWGWQSVHDPAMLPRVLEHWRRALASGEPFEMEFPLRGADGSFRWFLTRTLPLRDHEGKITRWFGTNTDVSALRDAQAVLASRKEELEALVAERTAQLEEVVSELSTFSYSLSHDLRAPLRSITSFAELLVSDYAAALPSPARDYLQRIERAGQRMDRLITDVLQYSRVSRVDLDLETFDPGPIIREAVEALSGAHPRATITIKEPFPKVRGSRTALLQAIGNLIGNALKFVRDETPPVITIWARQGESTTWLYVEDNGVGIAPEARERIWGLFERLQTKYEGTGLGLAIVKRAVERMGGRVSVESTLGLGSRFGIELPNPPSPGG